MRGREQRGFLGMFVEHPCSQPGVQWWLPGSASALGWAGGSVMPCYVFCHRLSRALHGESSLCLRDQTSNTQGRSLQGHWGWDREE